MWNQPRAIVWAQWKTVRNYFPRASAGAMAFSAILSLLWYGLFAFLAIGAAFLTSNADDLENIAKIVPGALLLALLYWQVIPILMVSMGSSLDLKKLLVYPIPTGQLFGIEVLLRVTTGIEVLLVLCGAAIGLLLNARIPWWGPLAFLPFIFLNLFLSAGMRDLLSRLLARKRIRELFALIFIMIAALPQMLIYMGAPHYFRQWFSHVSSVVFPWSAAADLAQGHFSAGACAALLGWTGAAYLFGRWQFERGLRFDADEGRATKISAPGKPARAGRLEAFYRAPGLLFPDPLAAMVEKELRFLSRAPRFRMVFIMGFSFGLLIWLPMAFGQRQHNSIMSENYLTVVSLYALLLLSDALFWNSFGFDRSAAQVYFLAPVKMSTTLLAKNISAMFFVGLEIVAIAIVCLALRLPLAPLRWAEALSATALVALFLMAVGNLSSLYNPRGANPGKSFRNAAGARSQAVMMLAFPLALLPIALAYGARWAFDSELAFFGVVLVGVAIGVVTYRISMESATRAAEERKERIITALSQGDGPIES
jgi:ABC-2 type transport system permease protein